ncbi:transposase zinc-binding domain-containing protein, partial [Kiritimatiellaeota bacterium B1221]|nr:transposase zinc-binding domain-containing protein [Kiritimatiellaeota bacterium B1221]
MSTRTSATVAEAILRHREAYLATHSVAAPACRLMAVLPLCRTSALGGHMHRCTDCGHEVPCYNSCGNRHCPNCQVLARERWLAKQEAALLDLPYFHLVFTLPAELQPILLQNKKEGYRLLFQSVAKTLLQFGKDPRNELEGQLGFTSVLHTWNQTLGAHAHLHVLIPAGALRENENQFQVIQNEKWLFPVRALSRVYRAIFLKGLLKLHKKENLEFHGRLEYLRDPKRFKQLLNPLYQKEWVVYAKRPFGGP